MQPRTLIIEGGKGERLAARLSMPADGVPVAYALVAHCFVDSEQTSAVEHICSALTRASIAVLHLDFTALGVGNGDAAGIPTSIESIVTAAAFLGRDYVTPAILIGHSLAGTAVLHAASRIPSATAVATIAAPVDATGLLLFENTAPEMAHLGRHAAHIGNRPFTVDRDLFDALDERRMRESVTHLGRALLILHSPSDEIVSVDHAARIFNAASQPKSIVALDGADHLLTRYQDACFAGSLIAGWARRYIDTVPETIKAGTPDDNRVTVTTGAAGFHTEILASGHALVADEPIAIGGTNSGPTPYDLVVAGLGACTSMTLRMYADRKKWPLESVTVRLRHGKVHADDCRDCEEKPASLDHIDRELELTGPLDDAQRQRLREIADRCPVHRTLHGTIQVTTTLREQKEESAQ